MSVRDDFSKEYAKVKRLLRLERERFRLYAFDRLEMGIQDLKDSFKLTDFSRYVQVVKKDHQELLLNQDRLLSAWAPHIKLTLSIVGMHRLKLVDTYPYLFFGKDGEGHLAQTAERDASKTLMPYKLALKSRGFNACLCPGEDDLQLWANCEPWMFDVVLRLMVMTEFRKDEDDECDAM